MDGKPKKNLHFENGYIADGVWGNEVGSIWIITYLTIRLFGGGGGGRGGKILTRLSPVMGIK